MALARRWYTAAAVFAVCIALVTGGGLLAAGAASPTVTTGKVLGRASFAYLTGLRTFAAAVLWNRLDVVNDAYYEKAALTEKAFLMPSIAVITMLDPHLVDAYAVGGWIVARNGKPERGLRVLREGVRQNPDDGHLRMVLAQVLAFYGGDQAGAIRETDEAVSGRWSNPDDEYADLSFARSLYRRAGRVADAKRIDARMSEIEASGADGSKP